MLKDIDYVDLHVHTSYSLLDGTTSPDKLAEATSKLGRTALAITDHGNLDGFIKHTKACKKYGINPIYGVELYMLEDWTKLHEGRPRNLHLTAIAKTQIGQEKLIQAMGFSHGEGMGKSGFSARPFLPMDYPLKNGWAGHVIISTGCASSPFWNAKTGLDLLGEYKDAFKDDLYTEIMPNYDWKPQQQINQMALDAAEAFNIKPIVTTDIHYLNKDDCEFHDVVIGLAQKGMTFDNPKRWKFESHCSHIHSIEQLYDGLKQFSLSEETIEKIIKNTKEIEEKSIHNLPSTPVKLPNILNASTDAEELDRFITLVTEGLEALGLTGDDYINRLEHEIDIIKKKSFIRYFLMVWDVIGWAKRNGIFIGPARGSVGGSLLAHCLGITNLDPIKYGLFFERFIDPDRDGLPDIDIDIEDRNRHLLEEYLREKYGRNNVAHVSTFGAMLGRSSIRDVSRFYAVPLAEADKMSKSIISIHDSDARANFTIEDTIESEIPEAVEFAKKYPKIVEYAKKIEGLTRGYGVHASGFVISNEDLSKSTRSYLVERHKKVSVNWDGPDLEYMGFVKLDLLGLSTLSAIAEALILIKNRHGVTLDMYNLPLDDKKTYEMISRGETQTLFQIGTPGLTKYCKELKPNNFEHLAACTALWRPGPMQSGGTEKYKRCKLGLEEPTYYNDAYKKITQISYGQLIYQEQISQLLMQLAGYTFKEADGVRKIVGKKLGMDEWNKHTDKFIDGCVRLGSMDREQAAYLWGNLSIFAMYAFNRAHSVGYGMLAYWTGYLKANYPSEWLCAYLNFGNADKEDKKTGEQNIDVALKEVVRLGIAIKNPDINNSDVIWSVDPNGSLRVGLKDIAFVGDAAQSMLARIKSLGKIRTFDELLNSKDDVLNKRVLKSMLYCGALDELKFEKIDKERLLWQFDDYWDALKSEKKTAEFLGSPKPEGDLQTIIDKNREEFLRFNPIAIDGGHSVEKVGELTGLTISQIDEELELVNRKGERYNRNQIESCVMPNSGVQLVNAVEGDFKQFQDKTRGCQNCDLHKYCKSPIPFKRGKLALMVVGETPQDTTQFRDDDKLWSVFKQFGIEKSMLSVSTVVKCRPAKGTKATLPQIQACEWLGKEIALIKPKFILSMGNLGLYYFKGQEKGINSYNAKTEWNNKHNAWVTYSINTASLYYHPENISQLEAAVGEFVRAFSQFL